jgi:membrane protein
MVVLPGFDGEPLYDVLVFFFRGLFKGVLTYRAAAIAYTFFLALIPFVMFLFTLIPFVTGEHYQVYLLDLLQEVIPSNIFVMVKNTIVEIISRPNQGLMSAGFFMAIYFATNGVDAIIEGFNQSFHAPEKRTWLKQKLVAFGLMLILSVLIFTSFTLLGFGELSIRLLTAKHLLTSKLSIFSLQLIRWIVILFFTLLSTSILYYFGLLKTGREDIRYRFFSAGSILSTGMFVIGGVVIKLYFENFSRYNILYGSIGSLIILLVWIYYNAFIILIGYELNASIRLSRTEAVRKNKYRIIR